VSTKPKAAETANASKTSETERAIARGLFRLDQAASAILASLGHGSAEIWSIQLEDLTERLKAAAATGALRVRHPETLVSEDFNDWPTPSRFALVCTVEDLNAWLLADGSPVRLSGEREDVQRIAQALAHANEPTTANPPLKAQARWRDVVLSTLRGLGHDPRKLPAYRNGTQCGSKAAARAALVPTQMTAANFDRAWQELRAAGEIANITPA
jgi:hypothetical protein